MRRWRRAQHSLSSNGVFPRRNSGFRTAAIARLRHSVTRFWLAWRSWHFWQRLLVRVARGLVAPNADARLDIALVVPTQVRFLVLRMRPVSFPAACRTAHSPASEATDANAALLAKRSHHSTRILATAAHRSNNKS